MSNVPLFELIAKSADALYRDALGRAEEHKVAGRKHAAEREMENANAYLLYRRSAFRNLAKARSKVAA